MQTRVYVITLAGVRTMNVRTQLYVGMEVDNDELPQSNFTAERFKGFSMFMMRHCETVREYEMLE